MCYIFLSCIDLLYIPKASTEDQIAAYHVPKETIAKKLNLAF
jgi:hypothetical protein